jgi:hypothetical protein
MKKDTKDYKRQKFNKKVRPWNVKNRKKRYPYRTKYGIEDYQPDDWKDW